MLEQKRAVSRLVEMTTSPSYAKEEWMPLSKEARRWEVGRSELSLPSASGPGPRTPGLTAGEDFAAEAGYSRPEFLRQPLPSEERDPPVIKEHHVWGVVDEWGDKAGRWGQGVKAFEDSQGRNGKKR